MKKQLKKVLPDNVKTVVTYQSKTLESKFPVKDKIDFLHQNNVVYYGKCLNPNCKDEISDSLFTRQLKPSLNK